MLQIDQLYAFIATDEDGNEGLTGFHTPEGWMPMVGADMTKVEQLRPMAQVIADHSGQRIQLIHFSARAEVETIAPRTEPT